MINLLPPHQKEEILEQQRLRLALILGIVFLSFFVSLFLILFLVRNYISSDLETQRINTEERRKEIALNKDLEKEITETNILLSDLTSFYEKNLDSTKVLEKINVILPSETYLRSYSLGFSKKEKEEIISVSLSGYCQNRDTLVKFKESLEAEEAFTEVNFSTESWVKPTEFKVNFRVK